MTALEPAPASAAGDHRSASAVLSTSGEPDVLVTRRVKPLRHPWRWVATAIVAVLVAQVVHGLVANPHFQWDRFGYWFSRPVLMRGLAVTLQVAAWSAVLGLIGGVVLAVMRLSRSPLLRSVAWVYIWLFRSIPLIVLLIILFNFSALYPRLGLGVPFGPELAHVSTSDLLSYQAIAILGLSLNEAAFAAEVVRAGILSVDQGQLEAADALGLSRFRQFRRVVFPQALRSIVPAYVNQLIGLIKATSLVFYVSLLDLFGSVQTMSNSYPGDIIPLLFVATAWYVLMTSVVSVVQYYVERYYARGAVRTIAPTPLQRARRSVRDLRARMAEETSAR